MANSYTQIHIQAVFVVKSRANLIAPAWEDDLHKYITGIVQMHGHKMLAINGVPDHLHLLFGMRPSQSLSDLMQDVKGSSSKWINDQKLTSQKFAWQSGYGAFSYSRSSIPNVIAYIQRQKEHHRKKTFLEEYRAFLDRFEVDYDEQYLFHAV